jgi:hypothetical protein
MMRTHSELTTCEHLPLTQEHVLRDDSSTSLPMHVEQSGEPATWITSSILLTDESTLLFG